MRKVVFLFFTLGMAVLNSCNKTYTGENNQTYIAYQSNGADFWVRNQRTNDTIKNTGIIVYEDGDVIAMEVNRNDSLMLVYNAPQKYANSKFVVKFSAFGSEYSATNVFGDHPSLHIVVVDSGLVDTTYMIQCTAVSDEWLEGSYDKGYVMVRVTE